MQKHSLCEALCDSRALLRMCGTLSCAKRLRERACVCVCVEICSCATNGSVDGMSAWVISHACGRLVVMALVVDVGVGVAGVGVVCVAQIKCANRTAPRARLTLTPAAYFRTSQNHARHCAPTTRTISIIISQSGTGAHALSPRNRGGGAGGGGLLG